MVIESVNELALHTRARPHTKGFFNHPGKCRACFGKKCLCCSCRLIPRVIDTCATVEKQQHNNNFRTEYHHFSYRTSYFCIDFCTDFINFRDDFDVAEPAPTYHPIGRWHILGAHFHYFYNNAVTTTTWSQPICDLCQFWARKDDVWIMLQHLITLIKLEIKITHQMCSHVATQFENRPYVLNIDKGRILVEIK